MPNEITIQGINNQKELDDFNSYALKENQPVAIALHIYATDKPLEREAKQEWRSVKFVFTRYLRADLVFIRKIPAETAISSL